MLITNIKAAIRNPIKSISLINRKYFQLFRTSKDEYSSYVHSWIYGKLKRKHFSEIFGDKQPDTLILKSPFSGTFKMSMTINEIVSVLGLVKHFGCEKILEIGTYDGGLTLNIAANTPESAQIYTMDLPEKVNDLSIKIASLNNNKSDFLKVGRQFKNTPFSNKITQIFADSGIFDFGSLPNNFDAIIIDGCHDYNYVKSDTENSLKIIRKGGIIIWHDYGLLKDVTKYIDKLSKSYNISVITGTRVAYLQV